MENVIKINNNKKTQKTLEQNQNNNYNNCNQNEMTMENQITINNSTIVNYTVKTVNHEATPEWGAYRTWEVLFTNTENNATAELWLEEGYFDCVEWNDYDENFLGDDQPDFSDDVEWAYGHTHSTLFREQFIKEIFAEKFV